jgi:16S rRNA (guanine527-N7)-methyltransferase
VERGSSSSAAEILVDGLAALELSPALLPKLLALSELLERWAARLNLTAHRTAAAIAHRLVLDALALGCAVADLPAGEVADLGSGAGFPGLPLAILWPERCVTLVEARERRHHFQRTAVRTLDISNVTPRHGRAEDLDPTPHALVVAQAAAAPEVALSWMGRWAAPGAFLAIPGTDVPAAVVSPPGVFHVETRSYCVPGGPNRTIWLGRVDEQD